MAPVPRRAWMADGLTAQQLTVYPTSHGLSFVLYHSNAELEGAPYEGPLTEDVPGAELIPLFREWEPQVRALIEVRIVPF